MTDLPIYPVLRESHSIGYLLQIQAEARPDRTLLEPERPHLHVL